MLRGLVGNWKQVIYYNFNTPYSKALLLNKIEQVESPGYPVVSIVHDMGPTNLQLWKNFDIDPTQNSMFISKPMC